MLETRVADERRAAQFPNIRKKRTLLRVVPRPIDSPSRPNQAERKRAQRWSASAAGDAQASQITTASASSDPSAQLESQQPKLEDSPPKDAAGSAASSTEHSSTAGLPEVSGLALRTAGQSIKKLRKEIFFNELLAQLPEELSRLLASDHFKADRWYPLSWLIQIHQVAQALSCEGLSFSRELGYEGSRSNFRGAHRFYVTRSQTALVFKRAPAIFALFYRNCGRLTIGGQGEGWVRVDWVGSGAFPSSLWHEQIGSCEAALELSGAKEICARLVLGGEPGAERTQLLFTWKN